VHDEISEKFAQSFAEEGDRTTRIFLLRQHRHHHNFAQTKHLTQQRQILLPPPREGAVSLVNFSDTLIDHIHETSVCFILLLPSSPTL
jgi:hypothetical protein